MKIKNPITFKKDLPKEKTLKKDLPVDKTFEMYSKMNNTLDKILKVAEDINTNVIKLHKGLNGGL